MKKYYMKSILSAALAVGMLSSVGFAAPLDAAPPVTAATEGGPQAPAYTVNAYSTAPVRAWGRITEKGENRIALKNSNESDPYHEIIVNISNETIILDAVTGAAKTFADLKENETVYAYVGPAMTRSLPPIANGVLVLCNIPADYAVPTYAEVMSVTTGEDGSISALTDGDVILHLSKDTELVAHGTKDAVSLDRIKPGARVLSWYSVVALSFPAQATPTKVMVFPYDYESYVTLGESGVTLDGDMAIAGKIADSKLLLPVRNMAEALGCKVEWVNESRSVVVSKGDAVLYTFAIGTKTVTCGENEMALTAAPQLLDGTTYVALDDLLVLHSLKLAQ